MSSILSRLRKLSDKIFNKIVADEGGVIGKPLTADERQAAIQDYMQARYPNPYAPQPKGAEERAHRNKNTAPDPLTKAANASCGAETSEGASAPSDHSKSRPFTPAEIAFIHSAVAEDLDSVMAAASDFIMATGDQHDPCLRFLTRLVESEKCAFLLLIHGFLAGIFEVAECNLSGAGSDINRSAIVQRDRDGTIDAALEFGLETGVSDIAIA